MSIMNPDDQSPGTDNLRHAGITTFQFHQNQSNYCNETSHTNTVMSIDIQPELKISLGCAYLNLCFMLGGSCLLAERQIYTRIAQNSLAHSLGILR